MNEKLGESMILNKRCVRILRALKDGPKTAAELAELGGCSRGTVRHWAAVLGRDLSVERLPKRDNSHVYGITGRGRSLVSTPALTPEWIDVLDTLHTRGRQSARSVGDWVGNDPATARRWLRAMHRADLVAEIQSDEVGVGYEYELTPYGRRLLAANIRPGDFPRPRR